jgi:hypothetical protein
VPAHVSRAHGHAPSRAFSGASSATELVIYPVDFYDSGEDSPEVTSRAPPSERAIAPHPPPLFHQPAFYPPAFTTRR